MNRILTRSVLSLAIALPLAAQEHDLKLSAAPGSSVWLRQVSTQSQKIDMGGQEIENKNTTDMVAHVVVKEVADDGSVIVEARLARVRGSFGVPQMGDFPYDSIDNDPKAADTGGEAKGDDGFDDFGGMMPDFDKIGKAAASIAGAKFTAKLDSHGKVTSIGGVEDAITAMQQRAGQMGGQMLAASFSEKAMKNFVESAFGERPSKPTAVGGSWEPERDDAKDSGTATKIKITLARVTDKDFEVTGTGTIAKPEVVGEGEGADESEDEAMLRDMQKNMKIENGKVSTRSIVSRVDGFLVEARTEMSMDVSMPGPFGDMEMKHNTTIVTTRTTEAAAMAREPKENGK